MHRRDLRIISLKIILSGLILLIAVSCNKTEFYLSDVSEKIKESPDSALCMLEFIEYPAELSQKDYAKYCQLLVIAHKKNKILIHNDTLIQFAVDYYKNQPSSINNYIESLILAGNVFEERDDLTLAENYYREAFNLSKDIQDSTSLGISSFELGGLYKYLEDYNNGIKWFKTAYDIFNEKDDIRMTYNISSNIADCYVLSGKTDTAIIIYNKLLDRIPDTKNSIKADVYKNMAMTYKHSKQYKEGLYCIKKSIELTRKESLSPVQYAILASIYDDIEQTDSTLYYTKKALRYAKLQKDLGLIHKVYEIILETEYDNVFENYILSGSLSESIYQKQKYETDKYHRLYNIEKIESRNKDLRIQRQLIITISVCVIACIVILFLYVKKKKQNQEIRLKEEIKNKKDIIDTIRTSLYQRLTIYQKMVRLSISPNHKKHTAFLKEYNKIVFDKDEEFCFDWNIIEELCNNVFENYADKIKDVDIEINETDTRVIILLKLGFSVSEIAILFEKSVHTMYRRCSNIRKKLNIPEEDSIIDFFDKKIITD